MTGGGLWSGMTERGRWQGVFICGHSGFPITNVGNDSRGPLVGNDRGGLWSGMTERGRWQGVFICGHSGFPITNVGNDRRGSFVGNDRRSFVGNDRRGSFRMGERDADDVRDENHEATGFFPANSHNSAGSPSCHSRRPPCHSRWPSLSCPLAPSVMPAVFSGNPELNL